MESYMLSTFIQAELKGIHTYNRKQGTKLAINVPQLMSVEKN